MGDEKAVPASPAEVKEAQRSLQKAGESLSWTAGFIALPWLKVRSKAKVDTKVDSYALAADGTVTVNPKWFASQRPDERVFEVAASMMRFLMRHHDRGVAQGIVNPETGEAMPGQEHNHALWNEACASVVNAPLQADAIGRAPADAVFPPADYQGPMDAESLYQHLLKVRPPPPPGNGGGGGGGQEKSPHAGGGVQPPPEGEPSEGDGDGQQQPGQAPAQLSADDIDQMRRQVEALARQAGRGSHVVDALRPKVVRANYRAVIGAGLDCASTESSERTRRTYSRASRREALMPEVVLPGAVGEDPSLCVVIDFSGSTSAFAQKFVDHAQKVATDYPSVRVMLIAHTSEVTYKAWLKPGGDAAAIEEASKVSGGTDFAPAYDAAREAARGLTGGKFDALVHFTDGYNFGPWPLPPARKLVVGLCGPAGGTTPLPMPAKVIPVTMGG